EANTHRCGLGAHSHRQRVALNVRRSTRAGIERHAGPSTQPRAGCAENQAREANEALMAVHQDRIAHVTREPDSCAHTPRSSTYRPVHVEQDATSCAWSETLSLLLPSAPIYGAVALVFVATVSGGSRR